MGTVTRTFEENVYTTNRSTWTLTTSCDDLRVSSSSFSISIPTMYASYTCSSAEKHAAYARIHAYETRGYTTSASNNASVYWHLNTDSAASSGGSTPPSFEPDTVRQLSEYNVYQRSIATSEWFNSSNPTVGSIPISFTCIIKLLSQYSTNVSGRKNLYEETEVWNNTYNVVLNAPPTFDVSALGGDTDGYYYKDHTVVSVTVSNVDIKYGGNLESVVFTIGSQSTGAPSATTFYIRLNTLGTFTPTVAVKDSRGQTTYYRFSPITVVRKPPTCTATVTSSAPYIINETAYTVNITNATATDATVSNIKLKIGNQTVSRSNDGTLSITPNTNGTFNPNVVITDSNGTSKTYTLSQITVQSPSAPTYNVTSTTSAPYVRTKNSYAVSITNATASYGGTVSSTRLTVGSQTVTGSVSSGTGTLTINPLNVAGTFTPSVEVTDNRGLTKTQMLSSITVLDYNAPSMSMSVIRCDSSGIAQDEGTYALVTAQITYSNARCNLKKPYMVVTNQSGTAVSTSQTWYTDSSLSNAVNWTNYNPNSPVTLYCLVSGNFTEQAYNITCYVEDSLNGRSSTIAQTLPPSFYTIDVQAGGKEIAFGKPANDSVSGYSNGLFVSHMTPRFPYIIEGENVLSYGECSTAAATAAKTVSVAFGSFTLQTGATIAVKFTNANGVADPTLNVNSTGAVPIMRYGTTTPGASAGTSWNAGSIVTFVYDGTNWQMVGWLNTTYSTMTDAEYQAGTSTSSRLVTPARLKAAILYYAVALADKYKRSSIGDLGWSDQTDGDSKVIAKSALAFWNGAYSGSSSNLSKCSTGNIIGSNGGTMSGQLKTSFKESVATGSYQASATTIANLVEEVRYSSGCMGSANITSAYTKNNVTVATGWYNFFYTPHRSGGVNGAASGDNCNYGTLIIAGMTTDTCGTFFLRVSSGSVQSLRKVAAGSYRTTFKPTSGSNYSTYGGCYYEYSGHIIHVHIGISGLTANTTTQIYTLPSEVRPTTMIFGHGTGGTSSNLGYVEVNTDGAIKVRSQSTYCGADVTYMI